MKKHIFVALIAATALAPVAVSARERDQRDARPARAVEARQDRPDRPTFYNRTPARIEGAQDRGPRQQADPQIGQSRGDWRNGGVNGDFNQNRPRFANPPRPERPQTTRPDTDRPVPGQWRGNQPSERPRPDWRSNPSQDRRQWDGQRGDTARDGQNERREDWRSNRDDRNDRWQRGRDDRRDDWQRDRDDRRNDWRGNRPGSWQGSWQARRGEDRARDDGWRGNSRWDNRWRHNDRYDWRDYRARNRYVYHLPRYYAPRGWGYGYRRFSIGVTLGSVLFSNNYWISDPYYYRLPPAEGPYRWVRYYNDALLVDIRSGYVVDVVYDIFW